MADTLQAVLWALEQKCGLRVSDETATDPAAASESVSKARLYSDMLRRPTPGLGMFEDVCITSFLWRPRTPPDELNQSGTTSSFPHGGFIISKEFEQLGGAHALCKMCSECPANIRAHEIAQCVGHVTQNPDSPALEDQLLKILSRSDLRAEHNAHFPQTTPLWYGLWARSPVAINALPILRTVLEEILSEGKSESENWPRQIIFLLEAIRIAEQRDLKLHVRLMPLGHTDLGFHTVFPHCPFCQAAARIRRWQSRYPSQLHSCHVCGTRYSPAETASSTRMDLDDTDLRELLGAGRFQQFARDYLVSRGESPNRAANIVAEEEARELASREQVRLAKEQAHQRDEFLEANVFSGVPCLPIPASEVSDEEILAPHRSTRWFDAQSMAEVLRRCEALRVSVVFLRHHSKHEDQSRFEQIRRQRPIEVLAKLQAEGCNEKFQAHYRVPDSLI